LVRDRVRRTVSNYEAKEEEDALVSIPVLATNSHTTYNRQTDGAHVGKKKGNNNPTEPIRNNGPRETSRTVGLWSQTKEISLVFWIGGSWNQSGPTDQENGFSLARHTPRLPTSTNPKDKTRQDKTRQDKTRQDKARHLRLLYCGS
jgi:hypothetical protein